MTKQHFLLSGTNYDTEVKAVEIGQIILDEGFGYHRYVVYEIEYDRYGYHYQLINLQTLRFSQTQRIRPLSERYGVGFYYDETTPEIMTAQEVAGLKARADECEAAEDKANREAKAEHDRIAEIGAQRLEKAMPQGVQGVIIAQLNETEYTDPSYECKSTHSVRTVILGFSTTNRRTFAEMRNMARNFPETAHLAEPNEEYEYRYDDFTLGEYTERGWSVTKITHHTRAGYIDLLAYAAGCEGGICLKAPRPEVADNAVPVERVRVEIVEYSEKSIAVFGDTEPIKHILGSFHGLYRRYLKRNGAKAAGWVYSKKQEAKVREALAPYLTA